MAMAAALARASHTREPEAIRGPDDMAEKFLTPLWRFVLNTEPLRLFARRIMTKRLPGSYGFVIPRSKSFDAFVQRELEAGAKQLVVLGAGYDSRAYRFREAILRNGGRAFEIDTAPTIARKKEKVQAILGELPAHVTYVPVDFDRGSMDGPLERAGYDPKVRSIFTWEGVSFYVSDAAVDAVLGFVETKSGPASGIVFDYIYRSVVDGTSATPDAARTAAYVAARGEPFTFGLDETRVGAFLAERGLTLDENLLSTDMEARYLGEFAKKDAYRVAAFYGIATAHVAGIRR
jgi:methyltransferase (TIGR00027 family)